MLTCGDFETQEKILEFAVEISVMLRAKIYHLGVWLGALPEVVNALPILDREKPFEVGFLFF
jgi:hypothetical protein